MGKSVQALLGVDHTSDDGEMVGAVGWLRPKEAVTPTYLTYLKGGRMAMQQD